VKGKMHVNGGSWGLGIKKMEEMEAKNGIGKGTSSNIGVQEKWVAKVGLTENA